MPCPWHQDGGRPCTHEATSLSSSASQPLARLWFLGGAGPRLWVQASTTLLTLEELCQLTPAEDIGKHTCGYKREHSHPFFFFLYLGESVSAGPDRVPSASTDPQPDGP